MPDASALWNLNRQLSFFIGATLLAFVLGLLQQVMPPLAAYRGTFILAAIITLFPLLGALRLDNQYTLQQLKQEQP